MVFVRIPVNNKGIQLDSLGDRLRIERERLGLSQAAFGELGGVQKLAQIHYEKGKRMPDANYLSAIAESGVDTCYILTGEYLSVAQAKAVAESMGAYRTGRKKKIATDEELLLEAYREMAPHERKQLLAELLSRHKARS